VLARGCTILRLARTTVTSPIFLSPFNNQITFPVGPLYCRLQFLDLSMATLSPTCLSSLLATCRQLKKLALENCELDPPAVEAIAGNPDLQALHLGGTRGLSAPLVTRILQACTQIQELNLGWCGLSEAAVDAAVGGLSPALERLCLSGNRETLLDRHIDVIGARCPSLRELDVSDATKLTSLTISSVVERLPLLESLSTSRCYAIAPSSYLYLSSCSRCTSTTTSIYATLAAISITTTATTSTFTTTSLLYLNVFGVLREMAMEELTSRLEGDTPHHLTSSLLDLLAT